MRTAPGRKATRPELRTPEGSLRLRAPRTAAGRRAACSPHRGSACNLRPHPRSNGPREAASSPTSLPPFPVLTSTERTVMPEVVFPLDSSKPFTDQQILGHNRYHPDIPAAVHVKPGDTFRMHCREWFDGFIKNDDSAQDEIGRAHV